MLTEIAENNWVDLKRICAVTLRRETKPNEGWPDSYRHIYVFFHDSENTLTFFGDPEQTIKIINGQAVLR